MATQKKATDPTEMALSAIEEALNLTSSTGANTAKAAPAPVQDTPKPVDDKPLRGRADKVAEKLLNQASEALSEPAAEKPAPVIATPKAEMPRTEIKKSAAESAMAAPRIDADQGLPFTPPPVEKQKLEPGRPANDDRRAVGEIIQSMKASRVAWPTMLALAASAIWVALVLAFAYGHWGDALLSVEGLRNTIGLATTGLMTGVALFPPAAFFVLASLYVRSLEMRQVSNTMAQVAVRLAEPENVALDAVVTLSHAIRREVAAMGDGIERAVARTSELETIVHSEIASLERAYGENEIRVRGLIEELINQREAIVSNSERVRAAIAGVHENLNVDLDNATQRLSSIVTQAGEKITHSLDSKTSEITEVLGKSGESMVREITASGGQLIARLDTTTEAVSSRLTEATGTVTAALTHKVSDITQVLSQTGERLAEEVAQSGRMMRSTLEETASSFNASVADNAEKVRASFASEANALTARLAEAGEKLREDISGQGSRLEDTLSDAGYRINSLLEERVREARSMLQSGGSEIATALDRYTDTFETRLATATQKATATMASEVDRIGAAMGASTSRFSTVLEQRGGEIDAMLGDYVSALESKLSERGSAIESTMGARLEALETTLANRARQIDAVIGQRAGQINATFEQRLTQMDSTLEERAGRIETSLTDRLEALRATLAERAGQIEYAIGGQVKELDRSLTQHSASLENTLAHHSSTLEGVMDSRVENLRDALGGWRGEVDTLMGQRLAALNETFTSRTSELERQIGERVAALDVLLRSNGASLDETLSNRIALLRETIIERGGELNESFSRHLQTLEETVLSRGSELVDRITGDTRAFSRVVEDRLGEVEFLLRTQGGALAETIGVRAREAADLIGGKITEFETRTTSKTDEITGKLDYVFERIDLGLDQRARSVSETLATRALDIAATLTNGSEQVANAITERAAEFERLMLERTQGFGEVMTAKADAILRRTEEVSTAITAHAATLETRTASITATLGQRVAEITSLFDERGMALAETLRKQSEETNANLVRTGDATARELIGVSEIVLRTLETRSGAIVDGLRRQGEEITSIAEQTSTLLRDAVDQSAGQSLSALVSTHDTVAGEMSALLNRLEETGRALGAIVENTGQNLRDIETGLSSSAHALGTSAGVIAERAGEAADLLATQSRIFNETANEVLGRTGALVARMDEGARAMERVSHEHAQVLEGAATRIETVEGRIASELIERRDMLENILAALEQRAGDVERLGQGFATTVGDQLRIAETRARDIATILAQSSTQAVQSLTGHYDAIRTTSAAEREETAAALSAAYEAATAEMASLFGAANDRFSRLVNDMRSMSAAIRDELDLTRAELSRGLVELPRETQETTASMRRAVSDQIKALNEISEIVARSGRLVETPSEAPVAPARPVTPRMEAETTRAVPPTPIPQAPIQSAPIQQAPIPQSPVAPQRPILAPRPAQQAPEAPLAPRPVMPPRPAAPQVAQPVTAPAKADERAAAQQNGRADRGPGWLSDLLARASRDEDETLPVAPRPPAPAPVAKPVNAADLLTTLSDTIGQLVVHDQAVDAWEGYLRGETTPFNRPLYSRRGVATFEEVRQRYERDAAFRTMIDAYIAKFEELLREIAPRDHDASISRSILASDEGKVYTLLAHASGRIA